MCIKRRAVMKDQVKVTEKMTSIIILLANINDKLRDILEAMPETKKGE